MTIGVWGAGNIGSGIAYRLATIPSVSRLFWINRTYANIVRQVIDIEQGLAFAPTCHTVRGFPTEIALEIVHDIDILILTSGIRVPAGYTRADVYSENAKIFRNSVVPVLKDNFKGIVLVITNPVDLMSRLVHRETGIDHRKVLGLGTVVETARLRASLGAYLSPKRAARDVWAYAIGTHDENFIPVVLPGLAVGDTTDESELKEIAGLAHGEVVQAANRVKTEERSSLHPIVEGAVDVVETILLDKEKILTVSVMDPESAEGIYYSVPCTVGRDGLIQRYIEILQDKRIKEKINTCCEASCKILFQAGEPVT